MLARLIPPASSPSLDRLRSDVRAFVAGELDAGRFVPRVDSWLSGFDPDFTARLADRGWIGMTWPQQYGGGGRTGIERYVVLEELLAAGTPLAAHWFADRQIGPAILRHGTEAQRRELLPAMAAGRRFVALGMSEPDAGSDLAAVRTRAVAVDGGWRVSGTKLWTSWAQHAHLLLVLCRTSDGGGRRHDGLSQLLVDLDAPGVEVRPITSLGEVDHFNEVVLDDVFVPHHHAVGEIGNGWTQVTAELAYERSGPERFLSVFPLFEAACAGMTTSRLACAVAELWSVRQLSLGVAAALDRGPVPAAEAALVKDVGTRLEQALVEDVRASVPPSRRDPRLRALLDEAVLHAPYFTLRGGTNEILRSVVAGSL